jgi:hypothetical protein
VAVERSKGPQVGLLDEVLGMVVVPGGVPGHSVDGVEVWQSCLEEGASLVVHMACLDRIGPGTYSGLLKTPSGAK